MLLFIVLALLVILTKSLNTLVATDVGFSFDAAVAIAGLLSYIGLFSYIFRPQRTAGKSFEFSRRAAALAEGHFETTDHLQQGIAVRPAARPIAGSSLVRRLVRAKDDPAKQRIRRSSVKSMMRGSFALASHRKILPRCVARRARRPRRPSPHKFRHPLQAFWMQRMRSLRAIRRGASTYPSC